LIHQTLQTMKNIDNVPLILHGWNPERISHHEIHGFVGNKPVTAYQYSPSEMSHFNFEGKTYVGTVSFSQIDKVITHYLKDDK